MAEQWVNLPKEDKFAEDGITKARCGQVTLEAMFSKKNKPIKFRVKVTPSGNNAVYTKKEKKNRNFKVREICVGLSDSKHVVLEESIYLAAAGGDEYEIEAKDALGHVVKAAFKLETRRKLYYQVIKMMNMTATVGTLTSHLEDEYWSPGKKYYIKLKQIASKGDMPEHPNFDAPQHLSIPTLAKAHYNNAKNRFCFALILVDQLAISIQGPVTFRNVTVNSASPLIKSIYPHYVWEDLDPAGTPEAVWSFGGTLTEATGTVHNLAPAAITSSGRSHVKVDTSSIPNGTQGTLILELKLVDSFCTGLSFNQTNLICVATRTFWTQRADSAMKSTLVHEAGHKIGMVPGGMPKGLAKQSSYYQKNGGHCNFSTNLCVMYGVIHPRRSNRFCSVCEKSVRRLDLDANALPGFNPP